MRTRRLVLGVAPVLLAASVASAGQIAPVTPAQVDVTISGASTFKGTLKGNCEINNNEHSVTIDAASGSTVFLRFFVQQVAKAPFTIVMEGLTPPKTAAYGRFNELKVGQDRYVATSGKGTLDDAAGRAGRFVADEFIRAAVASAQAPVLRAEISWKCQ